MPALLSFDTATDRIAVALTVDGRTSVGEGEGAAAASATLLPTIRRLLAEAGLRLADLDAIAFGRGPGAFTGLRTACSVAQGLAFGAGLPVLAIDTLLVVAEDARRSTSPLAGDAFDVWVAVDARMGEIYAARYVRSSDEWRTVSSPALWAPADLRHAIADSSCTSVAGNALAVHPDLADAGRGVVLQPAARPSANALSVLAEAAWRRGETSDPAQALPLYVRDKVASTTAERARLAAA